MVIQKNKFVGSFNKDSQADLIPTALMILMSMRVHGTTTENNVLSQGALNSAPVVTYNFTKKSVKTKIGNQRHAKSREMLLVIYNSLKLYSETRSKTAIDDLHVLGLDIFYQRVLDITKYLYDSQRRQYVRDRVLVYFL